MQGQRLLQHNLADVLVAAAEAAAVLKSLLALHPGNPEAERMLKGLTKGR